MKLCGATLELRIDVGGGINENPGTVDIRSIR